MTYTAKCNQCDWSHSTPINWAMYAAVMLHERENDGHRVPISDGSPYPYYLGGGRA